MKPFHIQPMPPPSPVAGGSAPGAGAAGGSGLLKPFIMLGIGAAGSGPCDVQCAIGNKPPEFVALGGSSSRVTCEYSLLVSRWIPLEFRWLPLVDVASA